MSKPQVRQLFLESKIIYYGSQILRYTLSTHRTTNIGSLGESCKKFRKILTTVFESKQTACFVTKGGAETQFQVSRRKGGRGSIPLPNDISEQKGMIEWMLENSIMQNSNLKIMQLNTNLTTILNNNVIYWIWKPMHSACLVVKGIIVTQLQVSRRKGGRRSILLPNEISEQKGRTEAQLKKSKRQKYNSKDKRIATTSNTENKITKIYLKLTSRYQLQQIIYNRIQNYNQITSNCNLPPNLLIEITNCKKIVDTSNLKKFNNESAIITSLTFKSKQNQIRKFNIFWVKGKEIITLVDKLVKVAIIKERAGKPDVIAIKGEQNPDR